MKLHAESHVDHVPSEVSEHVLVRFADRDGFFVETVELPANMPEVYCALYGPACGDPAVPEDDAVYAKRWPREWTSRVIGRPLRRTRKLTVVAGPYKGEPCVLFTVYGGPKAPRELNDPSLKNQTEIEESAEFWSQHALSSHDFGARDELADSPGIPMLADAEAMRAIETLRARGYSPDDVHKAMMRGAP